MRFFFLLIVPIFLSVSVRAEIEEPEKVKPRNISYNDFLKNYANDDTSTAIVELFFEKRTDVGPGQMVFFPLTAALFPISPHLSIGTSLISFPLCVNGARIMVRYRKGKLLKVLNQYNSDKTLPKWVRKKTIRLMQHYENIDLEEPIYEY